MEHPKDPGLPTPVSDDDDVQPPKPADAETDVTIPSEFGEDDPAPPEPTEAEAAAPAQPEPEQAEDTTPPSAEPSAEQPTPQKGTPWGWIIGIGCGCGCLLLIALMIAGPLFLGYLGFRAETDEQGSSPTAIEETQVEPMPDASDADFTGEVPSIDIEGPGLVAAILFGQSRKPAWSVQVATHDDDWQTVHLVLGPIGSDFTTWMDLQWDDDAGQYQLVAEGPLGVEDTGADNEVPDIYQPSEEVAKEAALTGTPDWVAKVVRHSPDWKSAVVWTGPPQSEWVFESTLRWDDNLHCYEIVSHEAIELDYDQ